MCASGGDVPRRERSGLAVRVAVVVGLLLGLLLSSPLPAQGDPGAREGVVLTPSVSQVLGHLQDGWIGWMNSFYQSQPEVAEEQLQVLLGSLQVLGFERLPELSRAATVRGVEAALQGSAARAEVAFDAAERLDPGRPETELGRAILARESGDRVAALGHQIAAFRDLMALRSFRVLWLRNAAFGVAASILLAGGLFVVVLLARRGPPLFRSMQQTLEGRVGAMGAAIVTGALLVWPLLLPHGIAWTLLYWSVLLWVVASTSQRVVLGVVWAVAGSVPLLVSSQIPRVEVAISPPVQAMNAFEEKRLYGTFFSDIGVLPNLLPDEPAVFELLGDVHRTLGQWEEALPFYRAVLERDPDDQTALVSVGAYYFRKGDHGNAVRYFQRAANLEPSTAAAYFNLSQAYSESYLFEEQNQALARARNLDDQQVGRWIQGRSQERVVTFQGGLAEKRLIRRKLTELTAARGAPRDKLFLYVSLILPLLALAFGVALERGLGRPMAVKHPFPDRGWGARIGRALLPGVESAEEGNGGRGFLATLVLSALVLLIASPALGFALPWGLDPSRGTLVAVAVTGLVLFFGFRVVRAARA